MKLNTLITLAGAGYISYLCATNPLGQSIDNHPIPRYGSGEEKLTTGDFGAHVITAAKAYGIPIDLALAVSHQESRGDMSAVRGEPQTKHYAVRALKAVGWIDSGGNPLFGSWEPWTSSHCALQIMGWNAPRYGLTWQDLKDPETCAEVGMNILANCKARKGSWEGALECYNGSKKYAKEVMKLWKGI